MLFPVRFDNGVVVQQDVKISGTELSEGEYIATS